MKRGRGRPPGFGGFNGESTSGIGYVLGTARTDRRLSLRQVAAVLGTHISYVSNVEHGRLNLSAKYVVAVSQLLNLDPSTVAALAVQQTRGFKNFKKVAG